MGEAERALREIALSEGAEGIDRVEVPAWLGGRFRWENYVPAEVRSLWGNLTPDARLVAFLFAAELARLDADASEGEFR